MDLALPEMARWLVAAAEPMMNLDVIYPDHDGARFNTSDYRSPVFHWR
jgi:hypothetical protein